MRYRVGETVRVEFYKYPEGRRHYWWEAEVVEVRLEGVLTRMSVGAWFHHEARGRVYRIDHEAYVAFFPGRWYSGGPDLDAAGRVLEYYWNVQTPPNLEEGRIWQYDLDLDVRCRADHACRVWDRAEFEARKPRYPAVWVMQAEAAVAAVLAHMRARRWPVRPPGVPRPWMAR